MGASFLGFGALVNPQAIALTRANAYQAARIVLGISAPIHQAMKAANEYTAFIQPKLNRAATVQQILGDLDFAQFVARAKEAAEPSLSEKIMKAEKDMSGFSLQGNLLGVPNWLLYGGLAVGGYFYYKKKKAGGGFKFFSTPAAAVTPPKV